MIPRHTKIVYWASGGLWSVFLAFIITDNTFNFIGHGDSFAYAYNFYFLSLLDGSFNVPVKSIGHEGLYLSDGTAFIYYGVGPALLRGLLHPFIDLSQTSVARLIVWSLTAASGLFCQSTYLYCLQQSKIRNMALLNGSLWLGAVAIWLASPLLILAAGASIYHEPIAFSFLCMIAFLWLAVRFIHQPTNVAGLCLAAALCAALSLHGRPHVALGLYTSLLLLLAWVVTIDLRDIGKGVSDGILGEISNRPWYRKYSFIAPVFLLLGLSGLGLIWLSYLKFGSLALMGGGDTVYGELFFGHEDPDSIRQIGFRTDGRFNVGRIIPNFIFHAFRGENLFNQLRDLLNVAYIRRERPFAGFAMLWLPWLVICMAGSAVLVLSRPHILHRPAAGISMPIVAIVLAALIPLLFITSYGTNTFRYKVEIWPFFWAVSLLLLPSLLRFLDNSSSRIRAISLAVATIATASGGGFSLLAAAEYTRSFKQSAIMNYSDCTDMLKGAPTPLPNSLCR